MTQAVMRPRRYGPCGARRQSCANLRGSARDGGLAGLRTRGALRYDPWPQTEDGVMKDSQDPSKRVPAASERPRRPYERPRIVRGRSVEAATLLTGEGFRSTKPQRLRRP